MGQPIDRNILIISGGFNPTDASYVTDLATAVAQVGTANQTLVIDAEITIATNLSVPTNINILAPYKQSKITVSQSTRLDIMGTFEAGNYQVFNTSGVVGFSSSQVVNAAWFSGTITSYPNNIVIDSANQSVTFNDQVFRKGELSQHLTIQGKDAGDAGRLYIVPKGSPSATTAAFKVFGTDYEADATNYVDVGLYYSASASSFYFNSKANGTFANAPIGFSFQDGAKISAEMFTYYDSATSSTLTGGFSFGGVHNNFGTMYATVPVQFVTDAAFKNDKMMRWYNTAGTATNGVKLNTSNTLEFYVGGDLIMTINRSGISVNGWVSGTV